MPESPSPQPQPGAQTDTTLTLRMTPTKPKAPKVGESLLARGMYLCLYHMGPNA